MVRALAALPPGEPKPNPLRVIFVADHMEPDRNTDCLHYDGCLDLALEREWHGGFSCRACQAFTMAPSALRRFV